MKILTGIATLMMVLFLSGCQTMDTSQNSAFSRSSPISNFRVDIVSEPSGAVVEINDNYIGKTPLTVELEGWEATRTFTRNHLILAHPVYAGGQTQVKSFMGWTEPSRTYGDTIPEKIYFNMSLIRTPEKYDININK